MGFSLITERTFDRDLIKSVITRSDMWSTVAEDGQNPDEWVPDVDGQCWLYMEDEGQMIGLYNIHAHNSITVEIHAHVLPECRKTHSRETGLSVLNWIYTKHPEYKKVVARIPFIFENVKNFTCSFGFKVEGVNRQSYLKNGDIVDQWMLGITRDEIKETLNV